MSNGQTCFDNCRNTYLERLTAIIQQFNEEISACDPTDSACRQAAYNNLASRLDQAQSDYLACIQGCLNA